MHFGLFGERLRILYFRNKKQGAGAHAAEAAISASAGTTFTQGEACACSYTHCDISIPLCSVDRKPASLGHDRLRECKQ